MLRQSKESAQGKSNSASRPLIIMLSIKSSKNENESNKGSGFEKEMLFESVEMLDMTSGGYNLLHKAEKTKS